MNRDFDRIYRHVGSSPAATWRMPSRLVGTALPAGVVPCHTPRGVWGDI